MDIDELATLAKSLSQDDFVARFPHLFLVFREASEGITPFTFHTEVASPSSGAPPSLRGVLRVLPLAKSAKNPYQDRVSVGRARNCDIVLRDKSVSKLHAHVRAEADGSWVLIDLGSQNGTSVGDAKVAPNEPVKLQANDLITVGAVTVRVLDAKLVRSMLLRLSTAPVSAPA